MAGYGVIQDWVQELEYLRAKRLKRFTMVHPILVEKFEVSTFCQAQVQVQVSSRLAPSQVQPLLHSATMP